MRRKPKLPGVHQVRGKGKEYHYAYRGGPRLPDPSKDLRAYLDAYQDALTSRDAGPPQRASPTVEHLIGLYSNSGDFARLAPSTQKLYRNVLAAASEHFGTLPVEALRSQRMPAQIRKWRDEIADRPRAADTRVEVLSSLFRWCERYGHIHKNPARGIEALHRVNRSEIIWTDDELSRLVAASTPEAGRAIVVAAYTGLRLSDLIGLKWGEVDFERGLIERATNKSLGRTRAVPPLLPEARKALETAPRIASKVLTSGLKKPWTASGLGNAFRDARNRIGVKKRFHDLRGTAATRFASAGCSAREIAHFMGWEEKQVEAIIRRYVSGPKLAAEVARRLSDKAGG